MKYVNLLCAAMCPRSSDPFYVVTCYIKYRGSYHQSRDNIDKSKDPRSNYSV